MKPLKSILVILFLAINATGFAQRWEWGKHVTGPGNIFCEQTAIDSQGNVVVAGAKVGTATFVGTSHTLNAAVSTPFLAKYNPEGNILWLVNIGDKDEARNRSLTLDALGNIFISGMFRSATEGFSFGSSNTTGNNPGTTLTSTGAEDAYLAKYDPEGNLLWARNIGQGANDDRALGVTIDTDNNVFVAGFFISPSFTLAGLGQPLEITPGNTKGDGFLVKYSANGDYLWHLHFASPEYARAKSGIALAPNNGVYVGVDFTTKVSVAGTDPLVTKTAPGIKAMAIFRVSSDGAIDWSRVIHGSDASSGNIFSKRNITSDTEGNLYAVGGGTPHIIFENAEGNGELEFPTRRIDGWLAKYSPDGTPLWAHLAGTLSEENTNSVATHNGVVSIAGYYHGNTLYLPGDDDKRDTLINSGRRDIFLANYSTDGEYMGSSRLGGGHEDEGSFVSIAPDGSVVLGASFKSTSLAVPGIGTFTKTGNSQDMLLLKYANTHFLAEETPISCNGANDNKLKITITGNLGPYKYSFVRKSDGAEIGAGNYSEPITFEHLQPDTYLAYITDKDGNVTHKSYIVKEPELLLVTASTVAVACHNGQTGELNLTVTGGTAPYAYLWSSENGYGFNPTAKDQSNVTAGTYTVKVVDARGCTAENTFTVGQAPKITFTGSTVVGNTSTDPANPNGSITPTVSNVEATATYTWKGPNSFASTSKDIATLRGGTYVLTVDNSGCRADTMFTVNDETLLNAYISALTNPKCKGGSDGSARVTYVNTVGEVRISWSHGQTDISTATGLSAGEHTVTVTDDNGSITIPFVIAQPEYSLTVSTTVEDPTCESSSNGAISLAVVGRSQPYTYTWTTTNGSGIVDGQQNQAGLTPGAYSVVVADVYGCEVTKNLTLIPEYPIDVALTASPSASVVEGTEVTLTASGGSTYEFFINDVSQGAPSAQDALVISQPVNDTRVKAVGYNAAGCSAASNEVTLTVNATHAVTFTVTNKSTGSPVEGAQVTIGTDSPVLTSSTGTATAQKVNGTYPYTVAATEYYSVNGELTVSDANVDVSILLISTGIGSSSLEELSMYPNPFGPEIRFTLTDRIGRIEVSNTLGQKVIDIDPKGASSINTQDIPAGIYLVKVTSKSGEAVVRKLLKSN